MGDPRLPARAEGTEAFELLEKLTEDAARPVRVVTAVPIDPDTGLAALAAQPLERRREIVLRGLRAGIQEDPARLLAQTAPERIHLVEVAGDARTPLHKLNNVVRQLHPPGTRPWMRRRVALATGDGRDGDYGNVRRTGLQRAANGRQAVDDLLGRVHAHAHDGTIVVVPAVLAVEVAEHLEGHGVGGALFAPTRAGQHLWDAPMWWSLVTAGLPPADRSDPMAAWAEALQPHAAALAQWRGRPQLLREIDHRTAPVTEPSREVARVVRRALREVERSGHDPRTHPSPLPIVVLDDPELAMSYDAFHHRLKVAPWVTEVDPALVLVMLVHELVHVEQVAQLAAAFAGTPRDVALVLDTVGIGIASGLRATMEDLAYRTELEVAEAIGLTLPAPGGSEGTTPEDRLRHMLARLGALPYGSPDWLRLIDGLVVPPPPAPPTP